MWFQIKMFFLYIFRCPSLFNSLSCFSVPKTKKKLLPFVFGEILRYSCERKCVFCKWSKFAYFMEVNISYVFANTPWGTVSKAVVCLMEVFSPLLSKNEKHLMLSCWLLRFYSAAPWKYLNISFTFLANHFFKNIILAVYFT